MLACLKGGGFETSTMNTEIEYLNLEVKITESLLLEEKLSIGLALLPDISPPESPSVLDVTPAPIATGKKNKRKNHRGVRKKGKKKKNGKSGEGKGEGEGEGKAKGDDGLSTGPDSTTNDLVSREVEPPADTTPYGKENTAITTPIHPSSGQQTPPQTNDDAPPATPPPNAPTAPTANSSPEESADPAVTTRSGKCFSATKDIIPIPTTPAPSPLPPNAKEPPPYAVLPSPAHGLGLFATTSLKRGQRILAEAALVTIPSMTSLCIAPIIAKLPLAKKNQFFSLSRPHKPEQDEELEFLMQMMQDATPPSQRSGLTITQQVHAQTIVWANSMATGADCSGIFATAARMNHSCTPNVCHSWNENLGWVTVHAIRDIELGEELCTSYIELCAGKKERAEGLGGWGVRCRCVVCEGGEGRAEMGGMAEKLTGFVGRDGRRGGCEGEEMMAAARRMVQLCEDDGIRNMEFTRWYVASS